MYNYPQNSGYMYGQQMQYPQTTANTIQNGLKGRPVSSLEEVRAAQIDFDGSLFIFPDLANHKIYTKKISMDGSAELNMYELSQLPQTTVKTDNFVTRDEFQNALEQIKQALSAGAAHQPSETKAEPPKFNF